MADEFKVHRLNEAGLKVAEKIATRFAALLCDLEETIPAGRERALVTTKLQEACFFAKRAIALQPDYQEGYAPHDIVTDQDESWCRNKGCTNKRSPICNGRPS